MGNAVGAVSKPERSWERADGRRRARLSAILAAAVAVACLLSWPLLRAHLQSIGVMREVGGQPVPWVVRSLTVPVTTEDFSIPIGRADGLKQVRARLYRPAGMPDAPAMVIFHGVHHLGIDEPRLMGFARAMASCGIRVLTPELPGIKDYHVSTDSVETIGESVKWFAGQTSGSVGVMGLSFAGGLALVAAADPQYHEAFKFVFAVGSQDSMGRVAEYYETGRDARPDGTVEVLAAHEYGPLVLEYEHLEDYLPAEDVEPVRAVLRAHLYEDPKAEAMASLGLNEVQKREMLALLDATSGETRARIAAPMAKRTEEEADVSPMGRLQTLHTPVYLLHGEADNIIPSAETLWMATELPREDLKAMLVSPVLSHINLDGPKPGAMDEWRLVHFFALVLRAAETRAR